MCTRMCTGAGTPRARAHVPPCAQQMSTRAREVFGGNSSLRIPRKPLRFRYVCFIILKRQQKEQEKRNTTMTKETYTKDNNIKRC